MTGLVASVLVGLVLALMVRAIYVGSRNRREGSGRSRTIVSLWTLLLASCFAASALAGIRTAEHHKADNAVASLCAEQSMQSFDRTAPSDRGFSRPDWEKFSKRFCAEAVDRGLATVDMATRAPLVKLRDSIIAEMLASGELHGQTPMDTQ